MRGRCFRSWDFHHGLLAWLSVAGCFNPEAAPLDDASSGTSNVTTSPGTTASGTPLDDSSSGAPTSGSSSGTSSSASTGAAETTTGGSAAGTSTSEPQGTTSGSEPPETTGTSAVDPGCGDGSVCVPLVPEGWAGPVVLAEDAASCPERYPELDTLLYEGLVPGTPQCSCSCNLGAVRCQLYLENEGIEFAPEDSCESPPFEDECLSAVAEATCLQTYVNVPAEPSWESTAAMCSGAAAGQSCGEGTCYPAVADESVCIQRAGEHECPDPFEDRTVHYLGFEDTRRCSPCTCSPTGQRCTLEVEICSVSFFQEELESGGECFQLNSSDGDGVTLFSSMITDQGTCAANAGGGQLSGAATPQGPVTTCCLP